MQYNRKRENDGKTYSIDRLTFDLYFVPQRGMTEQFKSALDLKVFNHRQQMSVQNFETNKLGIKKWVYQFDGFHVELYERGVNRRTRRFDPDTGETIGMSVGDHPQTVVRMDFNPNKCVDNPVLRDLMQFFAGCLERFPFTWSLSRVDYALDLPGKPGDFYVLSRKTETFYENTRYYGDRKATGRLKVYDKRQERIDKDRHDIGHDLTRFEWTQRGNRDFNFKFDDIAAYRPEAGGTYGALLQFCRPEMVNHALGVLDKRTRKKVKEQCFHPLTLDPSQFEILLEEYLVEYGIPIDCRRDWEKQFQSVPV